MHTKQQMWDWCYEKLRLCNMHVLFHVAWELHKQVQTADRCHQLVYAVSLWSLDLSVKHTHALCNSHFWLNHWIFTQISKWTFFPEYNPKWVTEPRSNRRSAFLSHFYSPGSLLQPQNAAFQHVLIFQTIKNRTINHVSHWWLLYAFSMKKKR